LTQSLITIFLWTILAISIVGVVLVIIWLRRNGPGSSMQGRITTYVGPEDSGPFSFLPTENKTLPFTSGMGKFREWLNRSLPGLSSESLQFKISSAYWPITDTEFIVIRILAVFLGLILGFWLTHNVLGGFFLGILLLLLFPVILERSIANRQTKFHHQLLDVLVLIKGAVQAGYSLPQALDLTMKELAAPSSEEFGRVLKEVRFGFPMEQALTNLAERMENDDLQIVVTAIIINSQVGGNLSTILGTTIETIRDRTQLSSEVRSLTSYARYVGNFLSFLPFIAGGVILLVIPDYFQSVLNSSLVQIVFVLALASMIIGNIWMRRIAKVKV
jgi:tight adherence protein B